MNTSPDLKPSSSFMRLWTLFTVFERSSNLEMKDLPWGIILIAKLRCPNKDNSSRVNIVATSRAEKMLLRRMQRHHLEGVHCVNLA